MREVNPALITEAAPFFLFCSFHSLFLFFFFPQMLKCSFLSFCQRARADLQRATVRLDAVQSFNPPIAAWSRRYSWERILPRSLAVPVAREAVWLRPQRGRKPYLITAKAFLKLAKCRRMLCSRALLLAIRGGPMGDYWEATKKNTCCLYCCWYFNFFMVRENSLINSRDRACRWE